MVPLLAIAGANHLPHSIPALSVDAIILGVTGLIVAYSIVAGYAALVRESISIYVGLVLANSFGKPIYDSLAHGGSSPVSLTVIQLLLLALPIVLLQFAHRHRHGIHRHNMVITTISALLTAMLLVSSALSQLDPVSLGNALDQSNLASWIYQLRLAWLALVPVAIVATALVGRGPRLRRRHSAT